MRRRPLPCALTIAGSDSGGGAGIQADLKTFAALGVHGTSAITCLTAQNPRGVRAIQPARPGMVRAQLEAVFAELPPGAVKTGMLYSAAIIREVAGFLRERRGPPLVVDPVMVATSGARLLRPSAIRTLERELLPWAALVTPNLDEAELLTGLRLRSEADLAAAARKLHEHFGCAALVKGGHLRVRGEVPDLFYDGRNLSVFRARRVAGVSTHGTGCALSAAIVAGLAMGRPLVAAIEEAKAFITRALAGSRRVGRHAVLVPSSGGVSLNVQR